MKSKKSTIPTEESSNSLDRRGFLHLGILGAISPLALGSNSVDPSPAKQAGNNCQPPAPKASTQAILNPYVDVETWDEPWVWEVSKWDGQQLQLQVVENQSPSTIGGFGNPILFSYNGFTPGPTIRMRGDETLRIKLINNLGLNNGCTYIGANTDSAIYMSDQNNDKLQYKASLKAGLDKGSIKYLPDWMLGEHVNGFHSARTTNLHTHGLHVRPGTNEDDSHSDDIYVRIIPQADYEARVESSSYQGPYFLEKEQVGEADYEFRLGEANGRKIAPHPPGTHWYHPHTHGATHNQVASGMAGFLIVEGDVDDAINEHMSGKKKTDPTIPTGDYQYRERLMLIQRLQVASKDADSKSSRVQNTLVNATNGDVTPQIIEMRPGAVERWRFLNGSVDGKGYVRFMVLEGQWTSDNGTPGVYKSPKDPPKYGEYENLKENLESLKQLVYVDTTAGKYERQLPSTRDIEEAKQQLYQLSMDGVTLVRERADGTPEYYIKDLKNKNTNPLYQPYTNLAAAYENEKCLKDVYNLSNELYMAPANRADFIFQAPNNKHPDIPQVYTIIAKGTAIHTENLQRAVQFADHYDSPIGQLPADTIIGYIIVKGDPVKGKFDISRLKERVSGIPVPDYLKPVTKKELMVNDEEAKAKGDPSLAGKYRTRKVTYSGWGNATWPLLRPGQLETFDTDKPRGDIDKTYLYDTTGDTGSYKPSLGTVVVGPNTRTMAIDGKKFDPEDMNAPKVLMDTHEEWVVYNNSISLWGKFRDQDLALLDDLSQANSKLCDAKDRLKNARTNNDPDKIKQAGKESNTAQNEVNRLQSILTFYRNHTTGYALSRKEAADKDQKDCVTRGIDHPFHVHTNPFWLIRVEVPDQNGDLVNILPEPRWSDVAWVPRNAGRIVFRSRYPDYTGKLVNHCHILQHEDNGMMQEVEIVRDPGVSNYTASDGVCEHNMSSGEVTRLGSIYGGNTLEKAYEDCSRVIDHNHKEMAISYEFPAKNGVFKAPKI